MMSTTAQQAGRPRPRWDVLREVFLGPPAVTREEVIQKMVQAVRVVGSPGFPSDEHEIATRSGRAYDRCYDPIGTARQAVATVASGDRTERLRHLKVPTLVIHGLADRMCDISGGRATAEAIPAAELITIEGMGHDLAPGLRLQARGTHRRIRVASGACQCADQFRTLIEIDRTKSRSVELSVATKTKNVRIAEVKGLKSHRFRAFQKGLPFGAPRQLRSYRMPNE